MIRRAIISAALGLGAPMAGHSAGLELPAGAAMTAESFQPTGEYLLPTGPYKDGAVQNLATTGAITQQAWRIGAGGKTSLQLMDFLRDQLSSDGYVALYECADLTCGGFDFRFSTQVISEPDMHVDLGDFRFLSARKPGSGAGTFISLLVSRSPGAGYVQIIRVGPADAPPPVETITSTMTTPVEPAPLPDDPIGTRLELSGHAVLADLTFETGSADLGGESFDTLQKLAAYLLDHPDMTIALVGHTDAEGTLESNIALSKRRATSVMQRLIDTHGIPADQVAAEGVGFLSPIASNLTQEGRKINRRVEVILTSTR